MPEQKKKVRYPYLRTWNRMLAGNTDFNVDRALADKAPDDVVYHGWKDANTRGDVWVRLGDLRPEKQEEVKARARVHGYI
jgi:hypothetical protein